MKVKLNKSSCEVIREPGDRKFYGVRNAAGESALLHAVKTILNEQVRNRNYGSDFIKKRMWKDGHLMDDMQQYLRSRKLKPGCICIFNSRWQIEGAEVEYNETGKVTLSMHQLTD
jgi:hypothetical protein